MTRHLLSALCMLLFAATAPAAVVFSSNQNVAIPFDQEGVYVNVFSNAVSYTLPTDFDNGPW
ncbi:MAG: hypothetical protein NTV80_07455, partial [Verrucomicrobia bacterium]|nr:hypothetical protein [Verrucomicrobiota bacterium]